MFDQPPSVFTSLCCRLVSDQFSIRLGNASRRLSLNLVQMHWVTVMVRSWKG